MTKFDLTDVWDALRAPEHEICSILGNFLSYVQAYSKKEIELPQRIRNLRYQTPRDAPEPAKYMPRKDADKPLKSSSCCIIFAF